MNCTTNHFKSKTQLYYFIYVTTYSVAQAQRAITKTALLFQDSITEDVLMNSHIDWSV